MLTVIDEYSRECLAIHVERRLRSDDVLAVLTDLFTRHGPPSHIRSDNGAEFTAHAVLDWLGRIGVKTLYIEPGSPWENGHDESFNGKPRDALLNGELFYSMKEATILIERWVPRGGSLIKPTVTCAPFLTRLSRPPVRALCHLSHLHRHFGRPASADRNSVRLLLPAIDTHHRAEERPRRFGKLGCQCNHHNIGMSSGKQIAHPRTECRLLSDIVPHCRSRAMDQLRWQIPVTPFADAQHLVLPPVECCRGVRPNHAARSRARAKALASPTAATSAVALIAPIPGTVTRPEPDHLPSSS